MAAIVATFDTKTKKLVVTQDGKAVADVMYVSLGRRYDYDEGEVSEDQFSICISTGYEDEESDIRTYTSLCANEQGDVVEKESRTVKSLPEVSEKVQAEIMDFLGK
jgi:hypothetical protein